MFDPDLYGVIAQYRAQSVYDLLAKLPDGFSPRLVVDLGCRMGDTTKHLATIFPKAKLIGIDGSDAMLEQARVRFPKINFLHHPLNELKGQFDFIFSNAALHYLDDSPRELLGLLVNSLNPNGVLAVQIPDGFNALAHDLLREIILSKTNWAAALQDGFLFKTFMCAEEYFELFVGKKLKTQIWTTTYFHEFSNYDGIVEWMRSSYISEFRSKVSMAEVEEIFSLFFERVKLAYPRCSNGAVIFKFSRLFYILQK